MSLDTMVTCDLCFRRLLVPEQQTLADALNSEGWQATHNKEHHCNDCAQSDQETDE